MTTLHDVVGSSFSIGDLVIHTRSSNSIGVISSIGTHLQIVWVSGTVGTPYISDPTTCYVPNTLVRIAERSSFYEAYRYPATLTSAVDRLSNHYKSLHQCPA